MEVVVSKGKGRVRIDYTSNGSRQSTLLEEVDGSILETTFDKDGSILDQVLLGSRGKGVGQASKEAIEKLGASKVIEGSYSEIKLQRPCPKCGSSPLTRYLDTKVYLSEVPVMPFYICSSCKERSYYMTDSYLRNLAKSNRSLFSEEELSQMAKDEGAFINELRANIIRIFASKRIMYVK